MSENTVLMTDVQLAEALERFAGEIMNRHGDCKDVALVGIQRRGAVIARRVERILHDKLGRDVDSGSLDITLYRDDWTTAGPKPQVGPTNLTFQVEGKTLILIDDVVYTGRTVRAALEALSDFGRPRKVELFAMVDRGHRELPVHPDWVALTVPTAKDDKVDVRVVEHDGKDGVFLVKP